MTKSELEAKVANMERALEEAREALSRIKEKVETVNYRADAPTEDCAAARLGQISAIAMLGLIWSSTN